MVSFGTLALFLSTTFMVVLSPGPSAIAVTGEAASSGFKGSLFVIFGIALANVFFFVLSATGIAALIIASNTTFTIIKWVGVTYLLYIGCGAIFSSAGPLKISASIPVERGLYKCFLNGFMIEVSNPKALLYFSALLPQFIDISRPIPSQLAVLCSINILIDLLCYSLYAFLGYKSNQVNIRPFVIKCINCTAGGVLIFAGLMMASVARG